MKILRIVCVLGGFLFLALSMPAQTTSFDNTDGANPVASLVQAPDGDLYGTTSEGGTNGKGTVFQITPSVKLTTLYSFCSQSGCADGANPVAAVIQAADGNFYGTTEFGGANVVGTIFKITAAGTLTTLYSFCSQSGCADGANPVAAVIQAADGNFYGTTSAGGTNGVGTVFQITPSGTLTTLYSFCSQSKCTDGAYPLAPLVQGTNGNFYGTTYFGGNSFASKGAGTVFQINAAGTLTTLYSFCSLGGNSCTDGASPAAGLLQATDGNFYGTTSSYGANGGGTVFQITPSGTLTTLYNFCSQFACEDGIIPLGALIQAMDGDLYGTTSGGGTNRENEGTIFKITPTGSLTTLYSFDLTDGAYPAAGLLQATDGNFYGTTEFGGFIDDCVIVQNKKTKHVPCGTVFSLSESFSLTAVPNTLTITQGNSGTSIIRVIQGIGFTGSVNLSASGLPNGVTAQFNPNPTTTTSTLTLTASGNAATGTSTVTITGTSGDLTASTTIQLTVIAAAAPAVTLTPTSLTFPKTEVGTTSKAKDVTLENSGTATLNITSITASGDFALVTSSKPCGSTLAAGKKCKIAVTFTPLQAGTLTGDVTITDNAPNSPQQVPLSGTGK